LLLAFVIFFQNSGEQSGKVARGNIGKYTGGVFVWLVCLFMCSYRTNLVSNSYYISLVNNWKLCAMKRLWPTLRYLRKPRKSYVRIICVSDRDANRVPHDTLPRHTTCWVRCGDGRAIGLLSVASVYRDDMN